MKAEEKKSQAAPSGAAADPRPVQNKDTLPNGMRVVVYAGTGDDILRASRVVNVKKEGEFALIFALAAQKCTFDGAPKVYEEIRKMDDLSCFALLGLVMGKEGEGSATSHAPSLPASTLPH